MRHEDDAFTEAVVDGVDSVLHWLRIVGRAIAGRAIEVHGIGGPSGHVVMTETEACGVALITRRVARASDDRIRLRVYEM